MLGAFKRMMKVADKVMEKPLPLDAHVRDHPIKIRLLIVGYKKWQRRAAWPIGLNRQRVNPAMGSRMAIGESKTCRTVMIGSRQIDPLVWRWVGPIDKVPVIDAVRMLIQKHEDFGGPKN